MRLSFNVNMTRLPQKNGQALSFGILIFAGPSDDKGITMKRRTFFKSCAAAAISCAGGKFVRAEEPRKKIRINRLVKPWPRPPVKPLRFDDAVPPSYAAMSAITPLPGSKRIYLQQPCDHRIITVRPDMKFLTYEAAPQQSGMVVGYGFVIVNDSSVVSFDYETMEQSFEEECLPLLTQRVSQQGFSFEQKSFTTTMKDGRKLLLVRLTIKRLSAESARNLTLAWLTVQAPHSRFYSHANEDYIVFEPWGAAWESPLNLETAENVQRDGWIVFDAFRHSENVLPQTRTIAGAHLTFDIYFTGEQEALIEFIIPYEGLGHAKQMGGVGGSRTQPGAFAVTERSRLLSLSFDDEYRRQTRSWSRTLSHATTIAVPEKIVQNIYRVLTCNNLQFMGGNAATSHLKPGQGGFNPFSTVYGWESSNYLSVMDAQGFHSEVERVLDYFLTTQYGHKGPEGDISTAEGSFRPHIHWMCETGALIGIFADHAILSGDFNRLRRDSAALLKAAGWISGQRARTKDIRSGGGRPAHYGLMPPGRATDWPDYCYSLFTDVYTWRGLDKLARSFEIGGFTEAERLRAEADDYRQCILVSLKTLMEEQAQHASRQKKKPENDAPPVLLSHIALLDSKMVDAQDDLIPVIEAEFRHSGEMNDLFATRMPEMEDVELMKIQEKTAGGEIDLYYVNSAEKVWHRLWLERGERIKALRYFYMTLAYSTSRDVHIASERFCPQLIWLLPWQPNASGNGRILEMMINSLCLEYQDSMHLLAGVPDAWFASGGPIGLSRLCTAFGLFSFTVQPDPTNPGNFTFAYECSRDIPKRFLLSLPMDSGHLEERRIVRVDTRKAKKAVCTIKAATGKVSFR